MTSTRKLLTLARRRLLYRCRSYPDNWRPQRLRSENGLTHVSSKYVDARIPCVVGVGLKTPVVQIRWVESVMLINEIASVGWKFYCKYTALAVFSLVGTSLLSGKYSRKGGNVQFLKVVCSIWTLKFLHSDRLEINPIMSLNKYMCCLHLPPNFGDLIQRFHICLFRLYNLMFHG